MSRMISLEFLYQGTLHHTLVRCLSLDGVRQVRVTIMNGELEALLSGHHIFHIDDGRLVPAKPGTDPAVTDLQSAIRQTLHDSDDFLELLREFSAPMRQTG